MSEVTQIFNGGESPLAAKVKAASDVSQTGPTQSSTQSDGGPAPDPASGPATQPLAGTSSEPPFGGVVRARDN
jgi:hypothetical protein